jgi:Na+-driven multidrug efflux pump
MGLAIFYAVYQQKLIRRVSRAEYIASLRPYFAVALPAIATQMATPAGNYMLTIVMARFGDEAVAAWAVVGRLTVLVFGGVFALSGAIGGIFGQNYGAGYCDRLRSTYRDALIFVLVYTLIMWGALLYATPWVTAAFGLPPNGADVVAAFTTVGVGGFMFIGALFVSNAAFNNLGKPGRSTLMNWLNHGVLSWPLALLLSAPFAAEGVVYGQALAGVLAGGVAGYWGWRYVAGLAPSDALDVAPSRPWPSIDRYRQR